MESPGSKGGKQEKSVEPSVTTARKLMEAIIEGDNTGIYHLLDAKATMVAPMGSFFSRAHVKAWLSFDMSVLKDHKITWYNTVNVQHGKSTEKYSPTAITYWSVAGLYFQDTIVLNQVYGIKGIKRVMERRSKSRKEEEESQEVLLKWTGPYFSKFCGPKKPREVKLPSSIHSSHSNKLFPAIDNRALILPVIDWTYCELTNCSQMLTAPPREGKIIKDSTVALHFLATMSEKEKEEATGGKGAATNDADTAGGGKKPQHEFVVIRAKDKEGRQAAIIIDETELGGDGVSRSKVESLEDDEASVKENRNRYVGSGIKLANNELNTAEHLDWYIRKCMVNAFYFLNWVDLSCNKIKILPDLSQYPISVFYCHDNDIDDISEVKKIRSLSSLHSLTLFGNPIQKKATHVREYKFKVLWEAWIGFRERLKPPNMPMPARPDSRGGRSSSLSPENHKKASIVQDSHLPSPPGSSMTKYRPRTRESSIPPPAPSAPKKSAWETATPADMPLKVFDHCVLTPQELVAIERYTAIFAPRKKR